MTAKKTVCIRFLHEIMMVIVILLLILTTYITSTNISNNLEVLGGWEQVKERLFAPDGR